VLPVDSEHNAIHQCLHGRSGNEVRRLILTASGGPFRGRSLAALAEVTAADALKHPTWQMGPKITIDSATLMNKGLEVIEAHHLFGLPPGRIDVLVHPQSLVHALVEFDDGSTLAQMGLPDMRTALAVGLAWPERIDSGVGRLDLLAQGRLEFEAPDAATFPCLGLARQALQSGGTAPATLNAANEVAVAAFLQRRIGFLDIAGVVEDALAALPGVPAASLEALRDADEQARRVAHAALPRYAPPSP
jgi:1-deoxy-D-xylulose-5-phosphate reductoisomerase